MKLKILTLSFLLVIFSCKNSEKNETDIENSRGKIIDASEINNKIKNGEAIQYKNATIIGDIDFTNSSEKSIETPQLIRNYVNSSIIFSNITFKGKIIAHKSDTAYSNYTTFNKSISFFGCTFQDKVDFSRAQFNAIFNISNSDFQEDITFDGAIFEFQKNYFTKNKVLKNALFNLVVFNGDIQFMNTEFFQNVNFQMAKFHGMTQFSNTKFKKNVEFGLINANSDIFFNYSDFAKTVNFNGSIFRGRTEFQNAKFNFISEFKNILFMGNIKFDNATFLGVADFENTIFYVSDISKQNINIEKGTNIMLNNTELLLRQTVKLQIKKNK